MLRRIGDILVSDEKIWNYHKTRAIESGAKISENVSFDDVKEFVEEGEFRIEFPTGTNLHVELHAFDKLLPILGQRWWSVLIAPDNGPEFICSDHPVVLVWKRGGAGPVGFGLRNTEVYFPFDRRVGFYGTYEDPLKRIVECSPGNVATMNMRVALNAERHVFSALQNFFMWHEGRIREVRCPEGIPGKRRL